MSSGLTVNYDLPYPLPSDLVDFTEDIEDLAVAVDSSLLNITNVIETKQPLDADLTAIAAISSNSGLLRKTAANTWSLDSNSYITGNQNISISGDVTGSGTTAIATTLSNTGVIPNTYGSSSVIPIITVDAKGRVSSITTSTVQALPSQTENSGKYLTTDGTNPFWGVIDLASKANINSPSFTGTPTAPTVAIGTNNTQIATTQFVQAAISGTGQVPSISGQSGKYLYTDGTSFFWQEYQSPQLPSITISDNSEQVLDSFNAVTFRSAEYLIQANQLNTSKKTLMKVLIIHDGVDAYQTIYGIIQTGSSRIPLQVSSLFINSTIEIKAQVSDADTNNVVFNIIRTLITD